MHVLTLILAGGAGTALGVLCAERPKPALRVGGGYRLIDFALSNVANSGLTRVAVLAQYHPQALVRHIGAGEPWDLQRRPPEGVEVWLPHLGREGATWYRGTADAVWQNRDLVSGSGCERVLILAGDHVSTQDYRPLLRAHDEMGADLTIAAREVPPAEAHRYGMMAIDADGRIRQFVEKAPTSQGALASMGVYVFNTGFLLEALDETVPDFGRDLIPRMVAQDRVFAHRFAGPWADIGSVEAYWAMNLALVEAPPFVDLGDPAWPVMTRPNGGPAARFGAGSTVRDALVAAGCTIDGRVIHSVLSPGVAVAAGAVVRDSVVMDNVVIGAEAVVDRCVVDAGVVLASGAVVGAGEDLTPNRAEPQRLATGITVVGARARVPAGVVIGRNCRIDPDTGAAHFGGGEVASGETVRRGGA